MQSRDDGTLTARYVLVLEAYGPNECNMGRPLVGSSYNDKIVPWWKQCTPIITREQVYITNTWDQGMPEFGINKIPEGDMRAAMERCRQRVDKVVGPDGDGRGPYVIVCAGNYALYTFTGNGRVSFHMKDGRHDRPGIEDWRGSVFVYRTNDGREIKVIAAVHPAATFPFRNPGLEWVCRRDWRRIATDGQFREPLLPNFTKMIAPTIGEIRHWVGWTRSEAEKKKNQPRFAGRMACSADVETPKKVNYETVIEESKAVAPGTKCVGCKHTRRWHDMNEGGSRACAGPRGKGCDCPSFVQPMKNPRKKKVNEESYLGCIGYCWDPSLAVCFPTTLEYWQDPELLKQLMTLLRDFHADPNIDFGGQNFAFDGWWAAIYGIPFWSLAWDLMKMHRTERPWSEWHDLAFQGSLDTRQPFWKHESKTPDEISRWSHNKEQLWAYNCVDNYVQRTLLDVRLQGLAANGRLDYYMRMESPIDDALLPMTLHGIRADIPGRQKEHAKLVEHAKTLGAELNGAAGMKIIPNIAVSTQKMKTFLYEKHRLPIQYTKDQQGAKKPSTNIVAIKRLMEAFPGLAELQTVGNLVLRHRRTMKKVADLRDGRVEADGRVYSQFKQDTLLGRLSAAATPKKQGQNLQNVDHELRCFYIADIGDEAPH